MPGSGHAAEIVSRQRRFVCRQASEGGKKLSPELQFISPAGKVLKRAPLSFDAQAVHAGGPVFWGVALPTYNTGCVRVTVAISADERTIYLLNPGERAIHVFSW